MEVITISSRKPIGFLAGTSLLESDFFDSLESETLDTRHGPVTVYRAGRLVAIQRHDSPEGYRPPHQINHKGHMKAFEHLGIRTIVSVQSVGSLKPDIEPGTFVVPDDFMNPWNVVTFYDDDRGHGVRQFDPDLRTQVLGVLNSTAFDVREQGTYVQTLGPRFETPAEANLLKDYGDIVGMTAASEVTLASELGMNYVTVCSVDNYVNGINGTSISMESFQASVADNLPNVKKLTRQVLSDGFDLDLSEASS